MTAGKNKSTAWNECENISSENHNWFEQIWIFSKFFKGLVKSIIGTDEEKIEFLAETDEQIEEIEVKIKMLQDWLLYSKMTQKDKEKVIYWYEAWVTLLWSLIARRKYELCKKIPFKLKQELKDARIVLTELLKPGTAYEKRSDDQLKRESQFFGSNLEWIIVNDGQSQDDRTSALLKYKKIKSLEEYYFTLSKMVSENI
jgi:hypothetical protein